MASFNKLFSGTGDLGHFWGAPGQKPSFDASKYVSRYLAGTIALPSHGALVPMLLPICMTLASSALA